MRFERGNAAAMREELEALRQMFDNNVNVYQALYLKYSGNRYWRKTAAEYKKWRDIFHKLREECDAALSAPPRKCDAALSAPPRKCDKYTDAESCRQAWLDVAENWDEFGSPKLELLEWLLAPAAERKGE